MTRRQLTVIAVVLAGLLICGGVVFLTSRRARQPVTEVALEGDGLEVDGRLAGGCLVDMLPPRFEVGDFVPLAADGGYDLTLTGPRPDDLTITVYGVAEGQPGEALTSTALTRPARRVAWQPPAASGDVILEVYAGGGSRAGECWLYWFPLTLE